MDIQNLINGVLVIGLGCLAIFGPLIITGLFLYFVVYKGFLMCIKDASKSWEEGKK